MISPEAQEALCELLEKKTRNYMDFYITLRSLCLLFELDKFRDSGDYDNKKFAECIKPILQEFERIQEEERKAVNYLENIKE